MLSHAESCRVSAELLARSRLRSRRFSRSRRPWHMLCGMLPLFSTSFHLVFAPTRPTRAVTSASSQDGWQFLVALPVSSQFGQNSV